jgi:hypothetical protein
MGVQGGIVSLIGCGASGVYALGPDEEEEECPSCFIYDKSVSSTQ